MSNSPFSQVCLGVAMWNLESDKPVLLNLSQLEGRKQIFELGRFTRSWRLCPFAPPKKAASLTICWRRSCKYTPSRSCREGGPKFAPEDSGTFWIYMRPFCTLWQMVELEKGYGQVRWDAFGAAVTKSSMWRHFFQPRLCATFECPSS